MSSSNGFDVVLKAAGPNRINVIKLVRVITGLGLNEAKDLVDKGVEMVKKSITKDEAEKVAEELKEAGAEIEIREALGGNAVSPKPTGPATTAALVRVSLGGFCVSMSTQSPGHIVGCPDGTQFGLRDGQQLRDLIEVLTVLASIQANVGDRQ